MIVIPANAIQIVFYHGRNKRSYFYVWPVANGRYQWDALGNNGEEVDQNSAIQAGRDWILYDRQSKEFKENR